MTQSVIVQDLKTARTGIEDFLFGRIDVLKQTMRNPDNAEKLVRMSLSGASRNPDLIRCTPVSWMLALMDSSFYGVEPNAQLGHAYLVPYKNNKRGGQLEVQFQIGYKGLILLACETGHVYDIDAEVVYQGDEFKPLLQNNPPYLHVPCDTDEDRGEIRGVYAVGWRDEPRRPKFKYLTRQDVERYRARSRAANSPFWKNDWDAMAKKTAIRRMISLLPIQPGSRLGVLTSQESKFEGGEGAAHVYKLNEDATNIEDGPDELESIL